MKCSAIGLLTVMMLLGSTAVFAVDEGFDDGSNNVSSGAVPFTVPDTLTGNLNSDGGNPSVDYFQFTAAVGNAYSVVASMPLNDVDVDIEDSNGTVIAQGANVGDENFSFSATTSTTYVVVYGAAYSTTYNVTVGLVSGINDWELY